MAADEQTPPADAGPVECGLGPLVARLTACAEDPMWADHAEVPKVLLRKAAEALDETAAIADHFMAQRDSLRDALHWIDGATAATPGLTDVELGKAMAAIGAHARRALGPNVISTTPR